MHAKLAVPESVKFEHISQVGSSRKLASTSSIKSIQRSTELTGDVLVSGTDRVSSEEHNVRALGDVVSTEPGS